MSDDRAPIDLDALWDEARNKEHDNVPIEVYPAQMLDLIAECRRLRAKIARVEAIPVHGHIRETRNLVIGRYVFASDLKIALADTEPSADGGTDA